MDTEPLEIERLNGPLDTQRVLRLRGPLTNETVSPFQNLLRNETAPVVFLDLAGVPYVDSAGLGTLVSAMVTCQKAGRSFVLSGVNPRVSKLFEITHVQDLFLVFPTLPEAVTALTNTASA